MRANELRIGNWVYDRYNITNDLQTVQVLSVQSINGHDSINASPANDYEPIPLTPDILEKCGLENDKGEYSHPDNTDFDLMICMSENKLWCAYNFGFENAAGTSRGKIPTPYVANPICNPFKYLHQFQNLYFALTGEEINYTP